MTEINISQQKRVVSHTTYWFHDFLW